MAQATQPLRIISQPKASCRERYSSEMNRNRNRSHRFIRADTNADNFDYPTIEIPRQSNGRRIYIRVTLVTVWSEQVPVVCVHPYPIDTTEPNVIKDADRNTLYFPVTEEDFRAGYKSFRIIREKLVQHELKMYGQLRVLNTDQKDIPRVVDPTDARKLIDAYQLSKSQLLFSIMQLDDHRQPIIINATSVYSNVMTASSAPLADDGSSVRCAPQKGDWNGGDEILMIIPKIDKRKACEIYFEYVSTNQKQPISIEYVDSKTISFVTPPCLIQANGNRSMEIPIVLIQNDEEIARVNFLYQSSDQCSRCGSVSIFDSLEDSNTYEQSSTLDTYFNDHDAIFDDHSLSPYAK